MAQNNSRIVFFRMDEGLASKSNPVKEWRLYTDKIFREDFEIGKIRSCSIFIYDVPEADGTYYLLPYADTHTDEQEKIVIHPEPNSITFVKFGLSSRTPIVSYAEVVDATEFETYYNLTKWLQKKLADEGYDSVKALLKGFTPWRHEMAEHNELEKTRIYRKKHKLSDTLFYDENNNSTYREKAKFYKLIKFENANYYSVKKYFAENNQLNFEGHYTNPDSMDFEGEFTFYEKDGKLNSKGSYHKDAPIGKWTNYYDTLNNPPWYTCNYVNGQMEGELTSYYLSGKIKRKEVHHYLDHPNAAANRYGNSNAPTQDTIVSGHCYDEKGNEITFTPFETLPEAQYNIAEYLGKNITYPNSARKKGITGRVILKFVIDTGGTVIDVEIIKHVSPDIDEEARRVISHMPRWKPATRDDKPVKVYYKQPIKFALE